MNAKQLAAQDLKHLALKLKGITDLATDLEFLGQLEQTEQEIRGRIATAKVEEAKIVADLKAAKESVSKLDVFAKDVIGQSRDTAEAVVKKAHADVEAMIAEAKRMAEGILAAAYQKELAIATSITDKRKTLELLAKEFADKEVALSKLNAERKALLAKLG